MQKKIIDLANNKPVAIFGTGASGIAVKNLLDSINIESVFYAQTDTKKAGTIDGKLLIPFSEQTAKNHSLVVYSPAFRPDHKWLEIARQNNAITICEPDLSALAWNGKIVAITGTNGKTTLTSFLTHIFNKSSIEAISVGNIGEPLCNYCAKHTDNKNKVAFYELSSFQTADLSYLKPDALVWTNFAPDHLDWHIDMAEYFNAKLNLLNASILENTFVGSSVSEYAKEHNIQLPTNINIIDENDSINAPSPFDNSIQARNFTSAIKIASLFNISEENVYESAKTFTLPSHRYSKPIVVNSVRFFNDSKATNAHATIAALDELKDEQNLIWIGGGKDKYCHLDSLSEKVIQTAKGAILIGQTAQNLHKILNNKLNKGAFICDSMKSAVNKAYEISEKNSAILFSPAFSSFGMFDGYAQRGKFFENEVLCLKNQKNM